MSDKCVSCGAILPEGAKLCTNCGKIVSKSARPFAEQNIVRKPSPTVQTESRIFEHKPITTAVIDKVTDNKSDTPQERPLKKPAATVKKHKKEKNTHTKLKVFVLTGVLAIAVAVSFCIVIRALRIKEIKELSYSFDTSAKVSSSSFGEAAESFLEEPEWSYSFLTNTVTLKGKNKNNEYEITFKPNDEQGVSSIKIDDEEYTDRKEIDILVLRMFM